MSLADFRNWSMHNPEETNNQLYRQPLCGWYNAEALCNATNRVLTRYGLPCGFFTFHGLRSGFVSGAYLTGSAHGTPETQIRTQVERTGRWTHGSRHFSTYLERPDASISIFICLFILCLHNIYIYIYIYPNIVNASNGGY